MKQTLICSTSSLQESSLDKCRAIWFYVHVAYVHDMHVALISAAPKGFYKHSILFAARIKVHIFLDACGE